MGLGLTRLICCSFVAVVTPPFVSWCCADTITFGAGRNSFQMEFVTIGEPANASDEPDHNGLAMGAVDYVYQIGKFEVACEAVPTFACPRGDFFPANLSWVGAAEFVNWLNNEKGFSPAYKLVDPPGRTTVNVPWESGEPGYDPNNPFRNSLARYVIPTANEWHKAAYYDPSSDAYFDYATASNVLPISAQTPTTSQDHAIYFDGGARIGHGIDVTQAGGLSPFGTMGQTGNAPEWEEGIFLGNAHATRSGGEHGVDLLSAANSRVFPNLAGGLRVVRLVPEPSPRLLCCVALILIMSLLERANSSIRLVALGGQHVAASTLDGSWLKPTRSRKNMT